MSFTITSMKTFHEEHPPGKFKSLFYYPLLISQANNQELKCINIETHNYTDQTFEFECKVIDIALQNNILWVVLESNKLVLYDIQSESPYPVKICNNFNYTIDYIKSVANHIYLITRSDEYMMTLQSFEDLKNLIVSGTPEIELKLKKLLDIPLCLKYSMVSSNGISRYTEKLKLFNTCPITGIQEINTIHHQIHQMESWKNYLLFSDGSAIWFLDNETMNVIFEIKSSETSYVMLKSFDDLFYFISHEKNETIVNCLKECNSHINNGTLNETLNINQCQSQEMLKNQLKVIAEKFINMDSPNPEEVSTSVVTYFKEIEDFTFLISIAKSLCTVDAMKKSLLYYLQNRISKSEDKSVIVSLSDLINKMDIKEYINFTENSSYDDMNLFDYNYKDLCLKFLENSDFELASLCWLKLSVMTDLITPEDVLTILNSIPHNAKIGSVIVWIKNFVPSLLKENPFYTDLIVRWTTERIFVLENSIYWPKVALKFVDEIKEILINNLNAIPILPLAMDEIDLLKDHIHYIIELKEIYNINMLLKEITKLSSTEVVLIMLHRCYTEDLELFLKDFLPNFTIRYNLELDEILQKFIYSEATTGGGSINDMRLKILLNAFHSTCNRLESLLHVLGLLEVPWKVTIQELATSASALVFNDFTLNDAEQKLAQQIGETLNYANLKVVLKKYNFSFACTDYMLVLNKIISSSPVNVNDLNIVMGVMTSNKNYGCLLYLDKCLADQDTKEALTYFNGLSYLNQKILLKALVAKYETLMDEEDSNTKTQRCYLDFFKAAGIVEKSEIELFERMYQFKNACDTSITLNLDYSSQLKDVSGNISKISSINSTLASSSLKSSITEKSKITYYLHKTSASSRVKKLIEQLIYRSEFNVDLVQLLESFLANNALLIETYEVFVLMITNCQENELNNLINTLYMLHVLLHSSVLTKNLTVVWKYNYIFMPMSSSLAIKKFIEIFSKPTTNFEENKDNLSPLMNKNDFMYTRLLALNVQNSLNKDNSVNGNCVLSLKGNILQKLIMKLVTFSHIDELLLTSLLIIFDDNQVGEDKMAWLIEISKCHNDAIPSNILSYLASPYTRRTLTVDDEHSRNVITYPPEHILKNKFNMNLGEVLLPDITEETLDVKVILFQVLKENKNVSLIHLVDICNTLNISVNDGISLNLIAILSSWELKYETYLDNYSVKKVNILNDEKDLLERVAVLWESLKDKEFLKDILTDFWKNGEVSLHGRLVSISPYFYEVYLCIFYLMFQPTHDIRHIKEYFLLYFLKNYTRKSEPQQYEFEMFSVKGVFPDIGHYRLPFLLFMKEDMWSNLKAEITLDTYEQWLPTVGLLSLDNDNQTSKDMICSNALKQTMKTRKFANPHNEDSSEIWCLKSREEPLLRAAHRCVKNIANMEWAAACLFYVHQGCSRGADQVAAAQLCYQFAHRWETLQPGNRVIKKMDRLYSTQSTRHVLHKLDWACEELLNLITEPCQLIKNMYLHPKLAQKMSRHDVNQAIDDIATKNGINISTIRFQMIENILDKGIEEETNQKRKALHVRELAIAKYILKANKCPKMGAIYLSRVAYDDESDLNKCKKLRALQCLMSIVDKETAIKVTNKDRNDIWNSLIELQYSSSFDDIDMPWIAEMFSQDKNRALEQACNTIGTNVNGLRLIADLARRYCEKKIILHILPYLLRASLYEEIIPLLLKCHFSSEEILLTSWNAVLLNPFRTADYPITDRQKVRCLKTVNLLPMCPVVSDDVLLEIWKNCIRCKCLGIGCLILPYFSPDARRKLSELRKIDRRNLKASVKNLQTESILVPGAMFVLEKKIEC